MTTAGRRGGHDGGMTFAAMSAIAKALMPDRRAHLTKLELDASLDEACRAFTAWKADNAKARRGDHEQAHSRGR
jgi:hypothetical protein